MAAHYVKNDAITIIHMRGLMLSMALAGKTRIQIILFFFGITYWSVRGVGHCSVKYKRVSCTCGTFDIVVTEFNICYMGNF